MSDTVERYPLQWPTGWKRTPYSQRRRAAFHSTRKDYYTRADGSRYSVNRKETLSVGDGLSRLTGELRRLNASNVIISSNLRVRNDGLPYASQAKQLDDPGVAVYFKLRGQPRVLACDKWSSAAENLAAIAGHIEAIRAVDRYGVGTLEQAFAGYTAIPAKTGGADWRAELGFDKWQFQKITLDDVETMYRSLARQRHPDSGGSHEAMARLNEAREAARLELGELVETR